MVRPLARTITMRDITTPTAHPTGDKTIATLRARTLEDLRRIIDIMDPRNRTDRVI